MTHRHVSPANRRNLAHYWLLLAALFLPAGWSAKLRGEETSTTNVRLADWSDKNAWTTDTQAPASVEFRADSFLRIEWSGAKDAPEGSLVKTRFRLKDPVPLPASALRAGLWIFIEKPVEPKTIFLNFADANGRGYSYKTNVPGKWMLGWTYVDTYTFDANERGKLHPEAGFADDRGEGLAALPLTLTGVTLETPPSATGAWRLGAIEADSYDLNSGQYHWCIVVPGKQYGTATTFMRSGEAPYLLSNLLMPGQAKGRFSWELRSGYQGPLVRQGEVTLDAGAEDAERQAERLPLGDLPRGNYRLHVTQRPLSLEQAKPTGWAPVIWRAEGNSGWIADDAAEGVRFLRAEKTGGEGYAGWRQTVKVDAPGTVRLTVSARGDGKPEVRLVLLDKDRKSLPGGAQLRYSSSPVWETQSAECDFPAEAKWAYIDLVTPADGTAEFDAVTLTREGQDLAANGSFENGSVIEQTTLALRVFSSPVTDKLPAAPPLSVNPGETLEIPLPEWKGGEGESAWRITDASGNAVQQGGFSQPVVSWSPPASGLYEFLAERKLGSLVLDRYTLRLGGKTSPGEIGSDTFALKGKTTTENDLYGKGKNYFTWSDYEYHPERPEFFDNMKQWITDGRNAGFEYIRLKIFWSFAEPMPVVFDFAMTDKLVKEVERQGGKIILEPQYVTPDWLDGENILSSHGRADFQHHGRVSPQTISAWSPGLVEAMERFMTAVVKRYRNNPNIAGYHLWGLPGSVDWTTLDRPWVGLLADFSPASLNKFYAWSGGKYSAPPKPEPDPRKPALSQEWRDWTEFRRHGLETFFIDYTLKPLRDLDPDRPIAAYYGLDFASERLTRSSIEMGWRRHTGGSELYYQTPMQAVRAVMETGKAWPQEVHWMTPVAGGIEHATFQISSPGGTAFHWNCYWRSTQPVGTWTADREEGLTEWQNKWRPLWQEIRDAELNQPIDVTLVATWSTMQYMVRTFFALRLGDYMTQPTAALYRDQLWPGCLSENGGFEHLKNMKLVVVPQGAAQVMPARLADALADYVQNGGSLALFPDSGSWVIEEPDNPDALLKRVGWKYPSLNADSQLVDMGNSGLPDAAQDKIVRPVTPARDGGVFPEGQPIFLKRTVDLPGDGGTVAAVHEDHSPAVITWPFGKGRVLLFGGTPEWADCPGLMKSMYAWAGGERDTGTDLPYVQANHLRKGDTHYVLVYRLLDSFRPHAPNHPAVGGNRAELRSQPPATAQLRIGGLPQGNWRMEEITEQPAPMQTVTALQLAAGIPVDIYLAQTKIFRLTPAK